MYNSNFSSVLLVININGVKILINIENINYYPDNVFFLLYISNFPSLLLAINIKLTRRINLETMQICFVKKKKSSDKTQKLWNLKIRDWGNIFCKFFFNMKLLLTTKKAIWVVNGGMSQIWGKVNKQTSETNIKKTSDRGIQIGKTQIQGNTDWNWKNAKVSKSKGVKMAGDTNNFLSTVLKKNKDRRRLMWN